jgi:lactate dehydrogenase-like 2-hydroxyacid dehydrogenase
VFRAAGPALRSVATMSVGYSNVDIAAAAASRVRVGNTPDVLTDATADLALALTLATCRRLPEALAAARGQGPSPWSSWKPFWMCGSDVHHKRVGIVGMGRIGEAIARRFKGFSCDILYTAARGAKPEVEAALGGASFLPLDALLAEADIVVLICPLTAATRGLIGAPQLARLRDGAVLINASRGEVVVQEALVEALRARPALRAGLDVTDPEPLPPSHALLSLSNCVVLPHIGSASARCREAMAELSVENALAGLEDEAAMPAEVEETRGVRGGAKR